MIWPPFNTLDLAAAGLLPPDWDDALHELAAGPDRLVIESGPTGDDDRQWTFAVVQGDRLRDACPWLLPLYTGIVRDFAVDAFARPLAVEERLRSAVTLNVLDGLGAGIDWHADNNAVSGLLFVSGAEPGGGGELEFRGDDGATAQLVPTPGTLVCFDASRQHRVVPLRSRRKRLTIPMVFHGEDAVRRPTYDEDVYL